MEIITIIAIFGILGFLIFDKFFSKNEKNLAEIEKEENERIEKIKLEEKIQEKNQEIMNELKNKISELEGERRILSEENIRTKVELDKKNEFFGKKENELKKEVEEKNIAQGKAKQLFAEFAPLKEKFSNIQVKNDELTTKIAKLESELESEKTKKTKDFEKKVSELEEARKSLEDEKLRVRREDEEKIEFAKQNRNRVWAEHEIEAISKMKEICNKPEIGFKFFENTTLPETFGGKFKPDFMIEFLGQYIIFDAKRSESQNLQNYINDQVKKTVEKIKKSGNENEIYSTVYFVVPTIALTEIKKFSYYEKGFTFNVIGTDAFESIIHSYKKITNYENLEKIDPQERENIINIIAAYDHHISHRNAIDILAAAQGIKISEFKNNLGDEMLDEIELKKKSIKVETFKPTQLQKFIKDPNHQIDEIKKMIEPKEAEIGKDEIEQISIV